MLKNELYQIKELIENGVIAGHDEVPVNDPVPDELQSKIRQTFADLRDAWSYAAFSTSDDLCLKRYFNFHLEGIREILDTLHFCDETDQLTALLINELLALIQYQRQYFGDYFNFEAIAPLAFCGAVSKITDEPRNKLKAALENAAVDAALKACLLSYLEKANFNNAGAKYTYHAVLYFERLVLEFDLALTKENAADFNESIVAKLTELNFNALDFFCYKRHIITKCFELFPIEMQLKKLHDELESLALLSETSVIYDRRWPSLTIMLKGWLTEEVSAVNAIISISQQSIPGQAAEKLSLNLSVAHLACLTRLFFEENLFNTSCLTAIFKFIARHYQTKRQICISTGSLSKEYYSVNQVTAAVIRDKLLKMVARINHDYFPALAAIGAITLLSLALR